MRKVYHVYAVKHRNGEWRWHGYCDTDKVPKKLQKQFKCRVKASTEIGAVIAAMDHENAAERERNLSPTSSGV